MATLRLGAQFDVQILAESIVDTSKRDYVSRMAPSMPGLSRRSCLRRSST